MSRCQHISVTKKIGRPPTENPQSELLKAYVTKQERSDFELLSRAAFPRVGSNSARLREVVLDWMEAQRPAATHGADVVVPKGQRVDIVNDAETKGAGRRGPRSRP